MTTPLTAAHRDRMCHGSSDHPERGAPLVLSLHWGLTAGGVTTWGVRLVNEMARQGRRVALILHKGAGAHAPLEFDIHPLVEIIDLTGLPSLQSVMGDVSPFLPHYREVARRYADETNGPVVLNPNIFEECYGIAAALCQEEPELVRVIGWQHNDNEYDTRVMERYEPMMSRIVGVSTRICSSLANLLPYRAAEIVHIPYGVPIPDRPVERAPLRSRPVRLLYAGRMEHHQKRVTALIYMAEELVRRGVAHELLLVGDGEAAGEVDRLIAGRPTIRRLPAVLPGEIAAHLEWADAYVLASRYEGLSIAMLEAMSRGCVPVVTGVRSGAAEAIKPGVSGELAPSTFDMEERPVAQHLADAVERFLAGDPRAMSRAAWATARARYSLERHAGAVAEMLKAAAAAAPRRWPAGWPCIFDGTLFSAVAPGGIPRVRALLASLAGGTIVIHGVGKHTLELGRVLAESPAQIVAFTDDDPARHGTTLWNWPVIAPTDAGKAGATEVIISSHTFQGPIWERRGVYEAQGIRVHRVYDGGESRA